MCEYIERMLMSARYYSIAHAYESIFEIHLRSKKHHVVTIFHHEVV